MNHTELIRPSDPASVFPGGSTKILLGRLNPRIRFRAKERKAIATGVSVMLKRPSLLCVCDMWTHDRAPYLRSKFCAVDSTHGTGNLRLTVHNLRNKAVKVTKNDLRGLSFCAFALTLDAIETIPLILNRTASRGEGKSKTRTTLPVSTPGRVSMSSTDSGQTMLRVTANRLKWTPSSSSSTPTEETKSTASVSVELRDADLRRILGFDPQTCSDAAVSVSAAETRKGTGALTLHLTHRRSEGAGTSAPPDSLVVLLTAIGKKKAAVLMRRGADEVLQKLQLNGFLVRSPTRLRGRIGEEFKVTSEATYSSSEYTALFVPYDVAGLETRVCVWPSGVPFETTVTIAPSPDPEDETDVPAQTPLGEVRFLSSTAIRTSPSRDAVLSARQLQISARGPEEYKVISHGAPHASIRGRDSATSSEDDTDTESDLTSNGDDNEEEEDANTDAENESMELSEGDEESPPLSPTSAEIEGAEDSEGDYTIETESDRGTETPDSPSRRRERSLVERYLEEEDTPRRVPPEDPETWNVVRQIRRLNKRYEQERLEDDYETELKIRLEPLELRILPQALAPFFFSIPPESFDPTTHPFYFTFLSRDREVLLFDALRGEEKTDPRRDGSSERAPRPIRA